MEILALTVKQVSPQRVENEQQQTHVNLSYGKYFAPVYRASPEHDLSICFRGSLAVNTGIYTRVSKVLHHLAQNGGRR